jgi:predicted ThiF/HesA family dinucleotide-utilizing enzyme
VELLRDGSDEGRADAAKALGNLAIRGDDIAAAVVAAGALPRLVELLSDGSDKGNANAAEALGILAYDDEEIAAAVMAAGAYPPLMELMDGGSDEALVAVGALAIRHQL